MHHRDTEGTEGNGGRPRTGAGRIVLLRQPGLVDFIAGVIVGEVAEVPEGLTLRPLPAGAYAAFACTLRDIGSTWREIYGRWLPTSGYVEDVSRPSLEFYPPSTPGPDEPVIVYLPITAA